jgi:HAD superfamily hydrolase (TIGR01509 family)
VPRDNRSSGDSASGERPVLFSDLGRVLVELRYDRFFSFLETHTTLDSASFASAWESFTAEEYRRFETGTIAEREFTARFGDRLSLRGADDRELIAAWNDIFEPIPEMLALVRRIHAAGSCRLVLLSNTNPAHFTRCLAAYPELSLFDRYVLSYEVGVLKPDPRIFVAARDAYPPGTPMYYIDDIPENIAAATRCGIRGMVFTGYEAFLEQAAREPVFGPMILAASRGS